MSQSQGPLWGPSGPAATHAPRTAGAAREAPAGGAAGSIYDLGYRRYEGPRLGRRHAIRAVFMQTFKGSFGIGRGGRAKLAPIILGAFAIIPAIVAVGVIALARQAGAGEVLEEAPLGHDTYYGAITVLVFLFCAIQAPELLGRDQRYHLLSLYFSRALRRADYALARFAGLSAAVLVFVLLPQAIIFFGLVLSATDVGAELTRELGLLPPVVAQGLVMAGILAGISALAASQTPRRVYATTAVIVLLIVSPIVVAVLLELGTTSLATALVLFSPADILEGTNAWLFDRLAQSDAVLQADLPGSAYLAAAIAITVGCAGLMIQRFRRIAA